MSTTQLRWHIDAPPAAVYAALIDPDAVARWMVPDDMTSRVHHFDARESGLFRISLTYRAPDAAGKSGAHTDTYHGRFVRLVPGELVIETVEFETADPAMRGEMTVSFALSPADGGTDLLALHSNVPPGIDPADNETGWRMSLANLARLLDGAGRREERH
ncbi:MAG TPA: SRPBCC family protein [Longimicrobiaceae bacterium]|jgi:uncharacterized protein YndB with AHSA1/START domain|nr:SRPBCC family protein [Longimicrobiaceae bacterium]